MSVPGTDATPAIVRVQDRLADVIEATEPGADFTPDRRFRRFKQAGLVERAEGPARWRFFQIRIPAADPYQPGDPLSDASSVFVAYRLVVVVGYPDVAQLSGEGAWRGVDGMVAADYVRLQETLFRQTWWSLPPKIEVTPPVGAGYSFDGKALRIPLRTFVREYDTKELRP